MEKNISITVPMDYNALTQAASMFRGLAEDLMPTIITGAPKPEAVPAPEAKSIAQLKENAEEIKHPEAAAVFAPVAETPVPQAVPPIGTDLDINGLPWDNRIHASTKTKLVTGAWKNKRNLDATLLATVEAELKGAMSAPETVLVDTLAPEAVTPAPAAVLTPVPTATPDATPVPPAAPGSITTFPELMSAITAAGLEPAIVTGAVQAVGLQSLPLLAARTDLIPKVVERLGLCANTL